MNRRPTLFGVCSDATIVEFCNLDLFHEVGGDGVDFGGVVGVDPWVVLQVAPGRILRDVAQLVLEVFSVADAVLMEAGLPDAPGSFCGRAWEKPPLMHWAQRSMV